jgi:tetratricopeptide (TPR) repeat protein
MRLPRNQAEPHDPNEGAERSGPFADANAFHQLGRRAAALGQMDSALKSFRRAVDCAPETPSFHLSLATTLFSIGHIGEAADCCRRALALKPHDFEAFACLVESCAVLARQTVVGRLHEPTSVRTHERQSKQLISVIVCSIDDTKRRSIRAHFEQLLAGSPHEIIQIADANSLCEGYNRGFAQSSGDILVFSHDDIEIVCPNLASTLTHHLSTTDVIGIAGTSLLDSTGWFTSGWPRIHGLVVHPVRRRTRFRFECFAPLTQDARVQAIDGVFMAATRAVCQAIPFDQATFDGFHFYDLDFSFRAYRAGFKLGIVRDILIIHDSMGVLDAGWARYSQRFVRKFENVIDFGRRSRDLRFGLAKFSHRAELIEFHRLLLPPLDECAGRDLSASTPVHATDTM